MALDVVVAAVGTTVRSDRLCRQLPNKAAFQLREEVARSLAEPELSSLTTFKGFSKAFRMYLIWGRLDGLGFRHDFATTAIAHTSSRKSSSTIRFGSMILLTNSLSWMVMYGNV